MLWGFSLSGGHCVVTAARDARIAALLLLCPSLDGVARSLATPPGALAWLVWQVLVAWLGRRVRIPVTGPPGSRAVMPLQGEADGFARIVPSGSPRRNAISPRVLLTMAVHRPITKARQIACPAFVALGERDVSVSHATLERFAEQAPRGELHRYEVDHFEPFIDDHLTKIADDQIAFVRAQGLVPAPGGA